MSPIQQGDHGERSIAPRNRTEDEWLWGWDPTPGIVSVWAEDDGRAMVWRRIAETGELVREEARFRPWLLLDRLDDLRHLGGQLGREGAAGALVSYRELDGPGALRYLVSADDGKALTSAVLEGATRRLGRRVGHLRELGKDAVLALPPEEQYLVATGRNLFPRSLVRPTAPACNSIWRRPGSIPSAIGSSWWRCATRRARRRLLEARRRGGRRRGRTDPPAGREGASGGSGRDREPQPAWVRPAVPGSARAHSGSAAGPRADRAAGIAAARSPARNRERHGRPAAACASWRRAAS